MPTCIYPARWPFEPARHLDVELMARIRSVHPGLFTDEAFVSISPVARIFLIGIWTECDDQGAFEWKPLTLKMRLLPADNADAPTLLAELEAAGAIRRYASGGKPYGAARNFQKWQRPKKPNAVHPVPVEMLPFLGASETQRAEDDGVEVGKDFPTSSSPVPHQSPAASSVGGNLSADGGGRMEDEGEPSVLRTGANGAVLPVQADGAGPPSMRARVFGDGIPIIRALTGKSDSQARSILGRLLQSCRDDCAAVHRALQEARDLRPADPMAWLTKACAPRTGERPGRMAALIERFGGSGPPTIDAIAEAGA